MATRASCALTAPIERKAGQGADTAGSRNGVHGLRAQPAKDGVVTGEDRIATCAMGRPKELEALGNQRLGETHEPGIGTPARLVSSAEGFFAPPRRFDSEAR